MVIDVPCVTLSYWYGKRSGSKVQFRGVIICMNDGILNDLVTALVVWLLVQCPCLIMSDQKD